MLFACGLPCHSRLLQSNHTRQVHGGASQRLDLDLRVYFEAAFNDEVDHMKTIFQYLSVPRKWVVSVAGTFEYRAGKSPQPLLRISTDHQFVDAVMTWSLLDQLLVAEIS